MSPYSDQSWLNFRQAGPLGGNVRKGERSTLEVFWKQHQVTDERDGEEVTRTIPPPRYFKAIFIQRLAPAESAGMYFV